MSHTYEKLSGNKAKLTFTIPAEQFDEAMTQAFLKMRKRINQNDRDPLRRERFL